MAVIAWLPEGSFQAAVENVQFRAVPKSWGGETYRGPFPVRSQVLRTRVAITNRSRTSPGMITPDS